MNLEPVDSYLNREFRFRELLNAPREVVFRAWTDPRHVAEWWGPTGFDNPVCELDCCPGGKIYIEMRSPDGHRYPMSGHFEEITRPERLVFLTAALDAHGDSLLEVRNTVEFSERYQVTRLDILAKVIYVTPAAAPALAGLEQGWTETLGRMEMYVAELFTGA